MKLPTALLLALTGTAVISAKVVPAASESTVLPYGGFSAAHGAVSEASQQAAENSPSPTPKPTPFDFDRCPACGMG